MSKHAGAKKKGKTLHVRPRRERLRAAARADGALVAAGVMLRTYLLMYYIHIYLCTYMPHTYIHKYILGFGYIELG